MHTKKFAILLLGATLMMVSCGRKPLITNPATLADVSSMFAKQKELAKNRNTQLFDVFNQKLTNDEKQALEYLYAYMPLSDLADYSGNYYLGEVKATLKARKEMPWVKQIPEEVYLHFVLPIRVNNENLDTFRTAMYGELSQRVKGMSMKDAALEVNHWCHEKVNYRGSDSRTSSPLSTIKTSWGRCGEESTFTVEAMRTVGIPSRQVYTPRWAHTDDNHAWVEVWIDGKWYFLGACEPDADLNMGWFAEPSRRTMLVHTRAFGAYRGNETVVISDPHFAELNLICNYAPCKTFNIQVTNKDNQPVRDAKVEYRLYNYCEFFPLASSKTDSLGFTHFTTGLGDLLIWASKDNAYGFQKITVANVDTVHIQITEDHPVAYSLQYDLVPPVQPPARPVSEAGQKANQLRLQHEDSIRNAYIATFRDSAWSAQLASTLGLNADSVGTIIKKSYGNWKEIESFLEANNGGHKAWMLGFLESLSSKDLRDTKASVLNDHFEHGFVENPEEKGLNQSFYTDYVLSPRIEIELLRPWRALLQAHFNDAFREKAQKDISVITQWIKDSILIDNEANQLSRCSITPRGVFELRVSDTRSRNIFFVALCRSMGIPARLNPINGVPQYFAHKDWNDVYFEKKPQEITAKGFLRFINATPDMDPKYYLNFTVAKLEHGVYNTLELQEGEGVNEFKDKVETDAGEYLLVTGNRIAGGSVLASLTFFEVKPGQTVTVPVNVRTLQSKPEKLGTIGMNTLSLENAKEGKTVDVKSLLKDKGAIFIWLDLGKEPSKHILNDLPAFSDKLSAWGGSVVFLFPEENKNSELPANYVNLPKQSVTLVDSGNQFIAEIEKMKKHELRNDFPVVIACDNKGNVIFFSEGYTIGIGEQLAAMTKFMQ